MASLATGERLDRLGPIVRQHLETGGKRLRARLALAATEALGHQRADAISWAAACELLHNATLIHDDVQDGDRVRRGEPTVWVRHGIPQAINAGEIESYRVQAQQTDDDMKAAEDRRNTGLIVAGSAIFNQDDYAAAIKAIRKDAE